MNATTTAQDNKQALTDLGKMFFHLSIGRYEDNQFNVDVKCLNAMLNDIKKCDDHDKADFFYLLGFQLIENMKTLHSIQDHWTEQFADDIDSPAQRMSNVMMHMASDLALMHLTNKRQYAADYNL